VCGSNLYSPGKMRRSRRSWTRALAPLVTLGVFVCSSSSASDKSFGAVMPLGGSGARASTRTAELRAAKLRGEGGEGTKSEVRGLKWLALRGGEGDLQDEERVLGKDVEGFSQFREDSILDYSIRDPDEDSQVSLDLGDGAWDPALTDPTFLPGVDMARERLEKPQNFSIWMQVPCPHCLCRLLGSALAATSACS